ncbi:MAG: DUF192 domain-containing protein [Candidatus Altiarchaeales archaeon]|nr:DUF192 domain-containing protein [Candidatus Altiarchaeota archaeon]MBU4436684.1 DUF192 domain-containing protein [Candidatus Altiarchaeota archaeon]MCG2782238.1 DUF192 domain-containing protein [Candidatus Altiarchaeales archaeon]
MVASSIFYWDSEKPIADESANLDDNESSYPADNESIHLDDGSNKVCFDDLCLGVEIASTSQEISRGLMHREGLDEGKGVLFVFGSERRHGFWMKNMKFSIDMIWIGSDGRVVHIERSVPACREDPCPGYAPSEKAKYVLETRANFSAENGIDIGSMAAIYTP